MHPMSTRGNKTTSLQSKHAKKSFLRVGNSSLCCVHIKRCIRQPRVIRRVVLVDAFEKSSKFSQLLGLGFACHENPGEPTRQAQLPSATPGVFIRASSPRHSTSCIVNTHVRLTLDIPRRIIPQDAPSTSDMAA